MNASWTDAQTWHPCLMSVPMVRAMLAEIKLETRRPVKWPKCADPEEHGPLLAGSPSGMAYTHDGHPIRRLTCPWGITGDGVYIREAWASGDLWFLNHESDPPSWQWYRADDSLRHVSDAGLLTNVADDSMVRPAKWRTSMHMLRDSARLRRVLTSVRVERVQDITEAGAIAEGIGTVTFDDLLGMASKRRICWVTGCGWWENAAALWSGGFRDPDDVWSARQRFQILWNLAYPGSWDRNEWTWVLKWA